MCVIETRFESYKRFSECNLCALTNITHILYVIRKRVELTKYRNLRITVINITIRIPQNSQNKLIRKYINEIAITKAIRR